MNHNTIFVNKAKNIGSSETTSPLRISLPFCTDSDGHNNQSDSVLCCCIKVISRLSFCEQSMSYTPDPRYFAMFFVSLFSFARLSRGKDLFSGNLLIKV